MVRRPANFLPIGPWIIETCFDEILGWSAAIADPVEQAFFVFTTCCTCNLSEC